jgi:hypothetical protein
VKVDSSLELSVLEDRPPPATDRVHFVFPFPGKLQALSIMIGLDTIIEIPMDNAKLELALVILPDGIRIPDTIVQINVPTASTMKALPCNTSP